MFNIFGKETLSKRDFAWKLYEQAEEIVENTKPEDIINNFSEKETDRPAFNYELMIIVFWKIHQILDQKYKSSIMREVHRIFCEENGISKRKNIEKEINHLTKRYNNYSEKHERIHDKNKKAGLAGMNDLGAEMAKNLLGEESEDMLDLKSNMDIVSFQADIVDRIMDSVFQKYNFKKDEK
jgi:hypothetical protein